MGLALALFLKGSFWNHLYCKASHLVKPTPSPVPPYTRTSNNIWWKGKQSQTIQPVAFLNFSHIKSLRGITIPLLPAAELGLAKKRWDILYWHFFCHQEREQMYMCLILKHTRIWLPSARSSDISMLPLGSFLFCFLELIFIALAFLAVHHGVACQMGQYTNPISKQMNK